jgi:parallel beta-helix repeat protein
MIQGYQVPQGSTAYSNDVRCVYMTNNVVLDGFTITGGATLSAFSGGTTSFARSQLSGGGVFCESTNSILTNCVLANNLCVAGVSFGGGGAVYQGTLNNCILSNNSAIYYSVYGGAASYSVLNNCLIISNSASFGGGAASSTLNHCSVIGNVAPFFGSTSWGGGTYSCTANYCLIAGNVSTTAGGGDCQSILNYCILSNNACFPKASIGLGGQGGGSYQSTSGSLNNCLVVNNYAGSGGGVFISAPGPIVTDCTIVGNTATNKGGGVYAGSFQNCIVYGNYCTAVSAASSNVYSAKLTNCWTSDPLFVNPTGGDYHLQSNSPCINSGNNAYVSSTNDLDGNPRIVGGTVDIGAYEYQTPSSVLSYAWAQQYGLPTDGTADYADSDGDGMSNYAEWKAGTNPTNATSVLALYSPATTNTTGITVTWQSVNTRTYYLQSSTNLSASPAFTSIQSNIVGQAGTTSYTDTSATNGGPYFYRVGVQ